jgi:hypothetical protein
LEAENLSVIDILGDLIGSVTGAPKDLSSNPKWMQGFGADSGSKTK